MDAWHEQIEYTDTTISLCIFKISYSRSDFSLLVYDHGDNCAACLRAACIHDKAHGLSAWHDTRHGYEPRDPHDTAP